MRLYAGRRIGRWFVGASARPTELRDAVNASPVGRAGCVLALWLSIAVVFVLWVLRLL